MALELNRIHGTSERVNIDNCKEMIKFCIQFIRHAAVLLFENGDFNEFGKRSTLYFLGRSYSPTVCPMCCSPMHKAAYPTW